MGDFNPQFALTRDSNPVDSIIGSIALTITSCKVKSLSFSQLPSATVNLDLKTYSEPIAVPF